MRAFKTRTAATEACRAGHVRVNGSPAKAASPLRVGDEVRLRLAGSERVLEVARLVERRVSAPVAAECYLDRSPPTPPRDELVRPFLREPGSGRPTKRDRRLLDRLREH